LNAQKEQYYADMQEKGRKRRLRKVKNLLLNEEEEEGAGGEVFKLNGLN
jgi:hypothetical protein